MTNFSPEYINSAFLILKLHGMRVKTWSEDPSNPELAKACTMLLAAGKQAQEAEK